MDDSRGRKEDPNGPISSSSVALGPKKPATPPRSAKSNSLSTSANDPILQTLGQLQEFLSTASILSFGIIIPLFWDWITTKKMGKKFDPAQDVQSLDGKVVLVTGGMFFLLSIDCRDLTLTITS